MLKRIKLGLAVIAGAMAVSIPVVLTAGATQTFTPDNLPLTILSQNNRTITYGWTPVAGYGYLFKTQATAGAEWVVVSRTNNPDVSSVKFSKGSYDYAVGALGEVAVGKASDIPPPADTQAPSAPTGLATSNVSNTGFTVSWNASNDNVGVTGYEVLLNSNVVGSVNETSYNFSGLTCSTTYSVGVRALDAANNKSSTTTANSSTTACPPPSGGTISQNFFDGAELSGTGTWTALYDANNDGQADDPGSVSFLVDGNSVANDTSVPFSVTWNSTTVSDGSHTFTVRALNGSGTTLVQNTVTATVNNGGSPPPPPTPLCSDGLDNDGDSFIDYPADTGCTSATDNDETNAPPPPPGGTISSSQCQSMAAVNGATISNVTVSGSCGVAGSNVTFDNVVVQGTLGLGNGTHVTNGSVLRKFQAFGVDNWVIENSVLDGQGLVANSEIWDSGSGHPASNWTIKNNSIQNYYVASNPGTHSEGLYVGYSSVGLIQGNTFTNNGNTGHIFFTYFGNTNNPSTSYPRNICVKGNFFYATHGAYVDINFRAEIPTSSGIKIQSDASTTSPQFYGTC